MAAPDEILSILQDLVNAYPGKQFSRENYQIYIDHLSDIHPNLIQRAVDNIIDKSTWFPRVSEIRAEAAKLVGSRWVSSWQPLPNPLWALFRQLEQQFWHHRILDPKAWLHLADDFACRDCPHSAAHARDRLELFQQILSGEYQPNYDHYTDEHIQQLVDDFALETQSTP